MRGTICADFFDSDDSEEEEKVEIAGGVKIVKNAPGPGSYEATAAVT